MSKEQVRIDTVTSNQLTSNHQPSENPGGGTLRYSSLFRVFRFQIRYGKETVC